VLIKSVIKYKDRITQPLSIICSCICYRMFRPNYTAIIRWHTHPFVDYLVMAYNSAETRSDKYTTI